MVNLQQRGERYVDKEIENSTMLSIARMIDIGCTSGPSHYDFKDPVTVSSEALRSDWAIIGKDMSTALSIVGERIKANKPTNRNQSN